MMAEAGNETSRGGVNFQVGDDAEVPESPISRHRATVRYNRKAVQKVLAIDEWIETQLEELYATSDVPVELSVDDVMKDDEEQDREDFIRSTLKHCPAPADKLDAFVAELVSRIKKV